MAFTSGSAGAAGVGVIDEVSVALMSSTASAVRIKCLTSSDNSVLINVPLLHGAKWLQLEPTDEFYGRYGTGSQTMVINAKALDNSNDASVSWGIAAIL
jgi:hypothetical protein